MLRTFALEERNVMAQKVQVLLVDDLDGGPADETVNFSVDGASYELDLSADNAAKLREALSPYVGSARRTGGRASSGTRAGGRQRPAGRRASSRSAEIRSWARDQGIEVSERGRIPAGIVEQWEKAHG
jgi:Lsr2